jgi:hypothetical protein
MSFDWKDILHGLAADLTKTWFFGIILPLSNFPAATTESALNLAAQRSGLKLSVFGERLTSRNCLFPSWLLQIPLSSRRAAYADAHIVKRGPIWT